MQNKAVGFWALRLFPAVLVALVAHNLWRWRESSLYWRAAPSALSPNLDTPPTPTELDLKPLPIATESSTVLPDLVKGAESFALSPSGVIYTGVANGELLELLPRGGEWEARTIGHFARVLGLRSIAVEYAEGKMFETLLACDSSSGLLEIQVTRAVAKDAVGPALTAKKERILSSVDGQPVTVCNGITFVQDTVNNTHVVITDSSEMPLHMFGAEVFAESGSGRVIHFAYSRWKKSGRRGAADHYARVIIDKLRFPNGVHFLSLNPTGQAELLVLECLGRALLHVDYNIFLGVATNVKADWVGTFHGDNIQPLRPRWPIGVESVPREVAPAVYDWGLSELPKHYYFVGVPHCTSRLQETFLYTSNKLRKFLSSWVPLPIRISLGNPVLFSNSAVAVYDAQRKTIVSSLKGNQMKFSSEALATKAEMRGDAMHIDFIVGAFASHVRVLQGSMIMSAASGQITAATPE